MKHIIRNTKLNQNTVLTGHAHERMHERSISQEAINIVMAYADIQYSAHSKGCVRIMMSRQARAEAASDGIDQNVLDRVKFLNLVLNENDEVITPYERFHKGKKPSNENSHRTLQNTKGVSE